MKSEIKIAVADKAQAMQYKGILEALGEKTSAVYYWGTVSHEKQNTLVYDGPCGWICTDRGHMASRREITIAELVEMLTKPKQKVVKVNNQVEYTTLLRDYIAKGWKWQGGSSPIPLSKPSWIPAYVDYNDGFTVAPKTGDKEVISFESLNLKAPDHIAEDGMPLWIGDKWWGVKYNRKKGWGYYDSGLSNFFLASASPTKDPKYKIFSTKNAALEWESAHRKVTMTEDDYALAYGDSYYCVIIRSDGEVHCMMGSYILAEHSGVITEPQMYKAFKNEAAAAAWAERPVLLTTDDGVRLREGDKVYRVKRLPYAQELTAHADRIERGVVHRGHWFSTLEAANAYIAKQNPVLLTTVDGADLREGDKWYPVYKDEKEWYLGHIAYTMAKNSICIWDSNPKRLVFSTKEAAEKWVAEQNKPSSFIVPKGESDIALGVPKSMMEKTIRYEADGGYANITKEQISVFLNGNPNGFFMDAKDLIEIYKLHQSI